MESETESSIFNKEMINSHQSSQGSNLDSQTSISDSNNCEETASQTTCSTFRVLPGTLASGSSKGLGSRGGYRKLPCSFSGCSRVFNRPSKLLEHVRSHTRERPFRCTFLGCNKDYTREDHLYRHMTTHSMNSSKQLSKEVLAPKTKNLASTENTGYYCTHPGCEKHYLYSHHLKRHERTHKDKSLLQCSWEGCDFRTTKRNKLHVHLSRHQGVLPYACSHSDCSKSFITPNKLAEHALTHIDKEKFLCGYPSCLARFSIWKDLNKHYLDCHPYSCNFCEKVLPSSTSLLQHYRTHGSDNLISDQPVIIRVRCPYPDCTSSFRQKKNLLYHIRTIHEQLDTQICTVENCGKKFLSKRRLQVHMNRVHFKKDIQFLDPKIQPLEILKSKTSDEIIPENSQEISAKDLLAARAKTFPDSGALPCPSPGCVARYHLISMLEKHLVKDHNIDLNSCNLDDANARDFAEKFLASRASVEQKPAGFSKSLDSAMVGSDLSSDLDSLDELDYMQSD